VFERLHDDILDRLGMVGAIFASWTCTQLIVGQEYLSLPGDNERFFPLPSGIFILAGALTLRAWDRPRGCT
jgi:hypothetical protein